MEFGGSRGKIELYTYIVIVFYTQLYGENDAVLEELLVRKYNRPGKILIAVRTFLFIFIENRVSSIRSYTSIPIHICV